MSLPMGFYNDLPYGIEIVAKENDEAMIYKIASSYESVNELYQTPDIAPSLYKISENIKTLLSYYEKYKNDVKYENITEETINFINNFENDEDRINYLITKYETSIEDNQILEINLIIITITLIIVIFTYKKIKMFKYNKNVEKEILKTKKTNSGKKRKHKKKKSKHTKKKAKKKRRKRRKR